jgi:hypothetical protein
MSLGLRHFVLASLAEEKLQAGDLRTKLREIRLLFPQCAFVSLVVGFLETTKDTRVHYGNH